MTDVRLLDIGSTYTKLVAFDASADTPPTSYAVPTTLHDLSEGVARALAMAPTAKGDALRLACSSAAGGLAVVVSGVVPRLSLAAARRAALGAGARITSSCAYRLKPDVLAGIERTRPQVVLLTGGTEGGDTDFVVHNARMLTSLTSRPAVVIACNSDASAEVDGTLADAGFETHVVANLLPDIDTIDLEPTRTALREVFLSRIAHGPGLARVAELLDAELVPTPRASMEAVGFLGETLGEAVMALEVGGATTNVHSHAAHAGLGAGVVVKGLPTEVLQRTVEGDLGVRHNADAVLDAAPSGWFERHGAGPIDEVERWIERVRGTAALPTDERERAIDEAMAMFCARTAIERHVGHQRRFRNADGRDVVVQEGKDLRGVRALIASGGAVIWSSSEEGIAQMLRETDHEALSPVDPLVVIDRHYLLYGVGLLSRTAPESALQLARTGLPGIWS